MMLFRVVTCTLLYLTNCISAFALEPDEVFAKVSAGIVAIAASTSGPDRISRGSGIIVGPGEIVTTCSAIENAKFIAVAKDTSKAVAKLRFADRRRDLCQLSVGKETGFEQALTLSSTVSDLRVGQKVFAIGAPDGIELTLTDGIVSSIRPSETGGEIQTTVPIWSGSSGGGLFDSNGNLVGVTKFDRTQDQELSIAIAAHWITGLPSREVDLIKKERLRVEREQRCFEQFQQRLVESFWDDEPKSILDPTCERVRGAVQLEKQLRAEEEEGQRRAEQDRLKRQRDLDERKRRAELAQQQLIDDFKARISAKVKSRVVIPPNISGNPATIYEVILLPGGGVVEGRLNLEKSSGVPAYDAAVRRAILAAQPLPVPGDPDLFHEYFRRIVLSFRPKE